MRKVRRHARVQRALKHTEDEAPRRRPLGGVSPDLKSVVGNRAISRMVQQGGPSPATIQRYPATVFSKGGGVDWYGQTASAKKPPGGADGVFFLKGVSGPIEDIVVKPETTSALDHEAEQVQMADTGFKVLGLGAPTSRVVPASDREYPDIVSAVEGKGGVRVPKPGDAWPMDSTGNTKIKVPFLRVMEKLKGGTMQNVAGEANDAEKVQKLIELVTGPEFMKRLGRIVATDAIFGYGDRVAFTNTNLGNMWVDLDGSLTTLDSGAWLPEPQNLEQATSKNVSMARLGSLDDLIDKPTYLLGKFLDKVAATIPDDQLRQMFLQDGRTSRDANAPNYVAGVQQGIRDFLTLSKGKKDQISKAGATVYGSDRHSDERKGSTQTLNTKLFYLAERASGATREEAMSNTKDFASMQFTLNQSRTAYTGGLVQELLTPPVFPNKPTKSQKVKGLLKGRTLGKRGKAKKTKETFLYHGVWTKEQYEQNKAKANLMPSGRTRDGAKAIVKVKMLEIAVGEKLAEIAQAGLVVTDAVAQTVNDIGLGQAETKHQMALLKRPLFTEEVATYIRLLQQYKAAIPPGTEHSLLKGGLDWVGYPLNNAMQAFNAAVEGLAEAIAAAGIDKLGKQEDT